MLERHDAEPDELVLVRVDLLRHLLVQQLHVRRREIALGPIVLVLEVQADHLDVDALAVHLGEALLDAREPRRHRRLQERADVGLGLRVLLDQRPHLGHDEVRVHVDRLDAFAFDQRGPAFRARGRLPAAAPAPSCSCRVATPADTAAARKSRLVLSMIPPRIRAVPNDCRSTAKSVRRHALPLDIVNNNSVAREVLKPFKLRALARGARPRVSNIGEAMKNLALLLLLGIAPLAHAQERKRHVLRRRARVVRLRRGERRHIRFHTMPTTYSAATSSSDNFALELGLGGTGDLEETFTDTVPGIGTVTLEVDADATLYSLTVARDAAVRPDQLVRRRGLFQCRVRGRRRT